MVNTIGAWIGALIIAAGVPSAIFGFLVRRIEKKIDKAETERSARDEARINHEIMLIDMTMASLELAEVTAEAVQRIPDAHCNGEMENALKDAKDIQRKYRNFERVQVVTALEKQ